MGQENNSTSHVKKKRGYGSIRSIFIHADSVDLWLMALGFLGAVGDGFSTPLVLLITSRLMNNIGSVSSTTSPEYLFLHSINKVVTSIRYFHVYIFFNLYYLCLGSKLQKENKICI